MQKHSVFRRYLRALSSYTALFSFITFVIAVWFNLHTVCAYSIIVCTIALICNILSFDDSHYPLYPFGFFNFWN